MGNLESHSSASQENTAGGIKETASFKSKVCKVAHIEQVQLGLLHFVGTKAPFCRVLRVNSNWSLIGIWPSEKSPDACCTHSLYTDV